MNGATAVSSKKLKKGTVDLTQGSVTGKLMRFTIPLLIGNIFQLVYNWTDAIIIGQTMGGTAFGALSASMPIINLLITLTMGFTTGASVILSQLFGNKDYTNLRRALSTTIIILLGATAVVTLLGTFISRPLLSLLNVSPEQIDHSATYLTYFFLGCAAMVFYNAFAQIIRSVGNSVVPLAALIVSTILNVGLDLLFVVVWDFGISGVAIATIIAQAISALFCFIYIQIKFPLLKFTKKDFVFDRDLSSKTMKIALPAMIQQFCASVGFMAINSLVNSYGVDYTTSFGLGNRIDELISMQLFSFSAALTTFAAQNKGQGLTDRIKKGYKSSVLISIAIIAIGGVFILCFKEGLVRVFMSMEDNLGGNPEKVLEITATFLNITVPAYFMMAIMVITSGLLRGTGDAMAAMSVNMFSLVCRIAAAFVLHKFFGFIGVFAASPVGWGAGAIWAYVRYKRGRWQRINIIRPSEPQPALDAAEAAGKD